MSDQSPSTKYWEDVLRQLAVNHKFPCSENNPCYISAVEINTHQAWNSDP